MRDLAETKYETKDIDRRHYRLFGTLHPQHAAQLAAFLSFTMYLATLVYICYTGYWYVFTTIFLAIVCCVEFLLGVSHRQKQPLESFITFAFIFHAALTGFIGVFIYFTLVTGEKQVEYEIVVVIQALFFILNAICISWMISFSKFVDTFNAKMAQEPIFRSSSDGSSSIPAKQSPRSTQTNNSIRSERESENSNNCASSGRPSTSGSSAADEHQHQQRHSTTSSSTTANRDTKIAEPTRDDNTKIMDSTIEDEPPPIRTSSICSDSRPAAAAAAAAHRTAAIASTNAQRSGQPNAAAEYDYLKEVFGE